MQRLVLLPDKESYCSALVSQRNMPGERRRAAALNRTHDLQLLQADVAAVGFTPSGTTVAEDIRDLQP